VLPTFGASQKVLTTIAHRQQTTNIWCLAGRNENRQAGCIFFRWRLAG
jgi:hypothetical protein